MPTGYCRISFSKADSMPASEAVTVGVGDRSIEDVRKKWALELHEADRITKLPYGDTPCLPI